MKVSQVIATYEEKFQEFQRKMYDDMQKQLQEHMQSLSQQVQQSTPPIGPALAHVSTKGSCASTDPSATDTEKSHRCELLVDGSLIPVGVGMIHMLGSTVHHHAMGPDMVRVSVVDVIVPDAAVPVPTKEVQTMGQALNTFLQWPQRLLNVISSLVCYLIYILF